MRGKRNAGIAVLSDGVSRRLIITHHTALYVRGGSTWRGGQVFSNERCCGSYSDSLHEINGGASGALHHCSVLCFLLVLGAYCRYRCAVGDFRLGEGFAPTGSAGVSSELLGFISLRKGMKNR